MDLNAIIRSEQAGSIQLVVTAEDMRKLLDGAIAWGMQTIRERDEPTALACVRSGGKERRRRCTLSRQSGQGTQRCELIRQCGR